MSSLGRLPAQERQRLVRPLLDWLAHAGQHVDCQWGGWRITPVGGGWSNLLYRVTNSAHDLAIKFTLRDARDRAGREYAALCVLQEAGLAVAPEPILLDRTSYAQPVVVQTWLDGKVSATPPTSDADWRKLVQHFALIHSVTPDNTATRLPEAVLNANTVLEGRRIVQQQVARIPRGARPRSLRRLVRQFERSEFPDWSRAPVALCRVDNNTLNIIRRPGRWASVDWENAGWGDPAFDVVDWMTHAAYIGVSPERWDWVVDEYRGLVDDPTASHRIQVYHKILLVWWVARLARYLYEVPRGLDQRLVAWPDGWQHDMRTKYEHYLGLAEALL